jgi:hypothetical protein
MELAHWRTHGANSGMQSSDLNATQVFVSSDGDPFETNKALEEHTKYALARFMVIAGQELGHFSDLMRGRSGEVITRFSVQPNFLAARKADILHTQKTIEALEKLNVKHAARLEKGITFLKKHRKFSAAYFSAVIKSYLTTKALQKAATQKGISIASLHSARHLAIMLPDMRFNLTPIAPVYERSDPREQEQMWCIEALARVPQQVIKWGHKTTAFMYPNLYNLYYKTVIPACIQSLKR